MKKIASYCFLILFLAACEKKTDWALKPGNEDFIVVDATIVDRVGVQSISLTYPVDQLNATPAAVDGASVVITDEDSTYILKEQISNPGIYATSNNFIASPGKHYNLLISVNNKVYTGKCEMIPGKAFLPVSYIKNNDSGLYQVDWQTSPFSNTDAAMYEILLDWSKVPGYTNLDSSACKARLLYYVLPTLDVSEIFAPQSDVVYFPAGTIITENRYSLTPAHAAYLRAMLLETSWSGGLFNSAQANVPTNISGRALGFFGACALTSLSLTVTP